MLPFLRLRSVMWMTTLTSCMRSGRGWTISKANSCAHGTWLESFVWCLTMKTPQSKILECWIWFVDLWILWRMRWRWRSRVHGSSCAFALRPYGGEEESREYFSNTEAALQMCRCPSFHLRSIEQVLQVAAVPGCHQFVSFLFLFACLFCVLALLFVSLFRYLLFLFLFLVSFYCFFVSLGFNGLFWYPFCFLWSDFVLFWYLFVLFWSLLAACIVTRSFLLGCFFIVV